MGYSTYDSIVTYIELHKTSMGGGKMGPDIFGVTNRILFLQRFWVEVCLYLRGGLRPCCSANEKRVCSANEKVFLPSRMNATDLLDA